MSVPRVLCFGGREYADEAAVDNALSIMWRERCGSGMMIIHGGARGADSLAGAWGVAHGFPVVIVPAQWDRYAKAAGSLRNAWMLELQPWVAIGFPGGSGSRDMARQCAYRGIPVWHPYGQ